MVKQLDPVIVIFGITGDLSRRKLLPSLYNLFEQNLLSKDTKLVGISRRDLPLEQLLSLIEESTNQHKPCSAQVLSHLSQSASTLQVDPTNPQDYQKLKQLLESFDTAGKRDRIFYMSIPPAAYEPIIKNLALVGLNQQHDRVLLEKPFGYDLHSAEQTIKIVHEAFSEEQIYRIDHYLAKETAQNLLAFRRHNPIFLPLWSNQHINSVRVRQFETIGIENRANFYEQTGALRDMIQSHLLQLLALTLMDVPSDTTSQAIHQAKQNFLKQLDPAEPSKAERGQYNGYRTEVDNPGSVTETYVKLALVSRSPIWQGTKLILEHGKAMGETAADVTIDFRATDERRHNSLIFRLKPEEGISLDLIVKEPGLANEMRHVDLKFDYHDAFQSNSNDAYERVLADAVRGDQSLFASDEEVLTTWRILQPILDAWHGNDKGLILYPTGTIKVQP